MVRNVVPRESLKQSLVSRENEVEKHERSRERPLLEGDPAKSVNLQDKFNRTESLEDANNNQETTDRSNS